MTNSVLFNGRSWPTLKAAISSRGSGGLRKLRWAGSGRPKRGGLRVIYYWHVTGSVILLLLAYPKNEQEALTTAQLKVLKTIIETEFP